jgi:hypothetical protein
MDFRESFTKALATQAKGQLREAMLFLDATLLKQPDFAPAWNSRGAALQGLGHPFDAVLNYDRAIALVPDSAESYNNRGAAYLDLEQFDKAIDDFKRAFRRSNKIPEIPNNKANALMRMRRVEEALEAYNTAIKIKPDYGNAHLGKAMALLTLGLLKEGFEEFEWRWQGPVMKPRGFGYPIWAGEAATRPEDILLIYGEQGMGDVLQFCRFAKQAKAKWGGKVYLEVVHPLTRLLRGVDGVDGIITLGEKPPLGIKSCIAMLSVPRVLGITLETIPAECPYLPYDDYRASVWRDRLKALPDGLLVGVCWAGMNRDADPLASSIDARRSMSLQQFAPLAQLKGISWVSLQLGPAKEQIKGGLPGMTIGDWTADLYDFFDTAALIQCLDLVITVDTSVAHVAGGLGKPTWLLSRYDACWRWLMDRDTTPWYPTMQLFTQKKPHDWEEVLERMTSALRELADQRRIKMADKTAWAGKPSRKYVPSAVISEEFRV